MWQEALMRPSSNIFSQTIVIDNQDAHLAQASQQEIIFDNIPVDSDIILLEIDGYNSNAAYKFHQTFSPWFHQSKFCYNYLNAGSETLGFGTFTGVSKITNATGFCPLGDLGKSSGKWTLVFKLPN